MVGCEGECLAVRGDVASEDRRIGRHRVFDGVAMRGKSSMGWFYGFKLHLIVNDRGELLAVQLTPGNIDDRKPVPQIEQETMR